MITTTFSQLSKVVPCYDEATSFSVVDGNFVCFSFCVLSPLFSPNRRSSNRLKLSWRCTKFTVGSQLLLHTSEGIRQVGRYAIGIYFNLIKSLWKINPSSSLNRIAPRNNNKNKQKPMEDSLFFVWSSSTFSSFLLGTDPGHLPSEGLLDLS